MDLSAIREASVKVAKQLGYPVNPGLPLLDPIEAVVTREQLIDRVLVLYACVACSYGFPKDKALFWVSRQGLSTAVACSEVEYLQGKAERRKSAVQWQVEALWALAWAAGYVKDLGFSDSCSDNFVKIFPDLKSDADTLEFRKKAKPRGSVVIAESLDLLYCLHWAVRDAEINGRPFPGKLPLLVVQERRRALEWVAYSGDWDNVSLDT